MLSEGPTKSAWGTRVSGFDSRRTSGQHMDQRRCVLGIPLILVSLEAEKVVPTRLRFVVMQKLRRILRRFVCRALSIHSLNRHSFQCVTTVRCQRYNTATTVWLQ